MAAWFREFTSAFKNPCYRWLWVQSLLGTVGGIISGQFTFFWYQDCFPHGYYFFSWKVPTSSRGQ